MESGSAVTVETVVLFWATRSCGAESRIEKRPVIKTSFFIAVPFTAEVRNSFL
jgi:hypothetical protein